MSKAKESLLHTLELLQTEREADFEFYQKQIEQQPLKERVERGFSWYQVEPIKRGYTHGDRAFVTVTRQQVDHPHRFRAGQTVRLFTRQAGIKNPEAKGVIHSVNRQRMRIILSGKDLPDWLGIGLLGVDLLFDDRTYREMEKAMKAVLEAKNGRLAELREILLGTAPAEFDEYRLPAPLGALNDSQNEAVHEILCARQVAAVHGPPGTGKTTTLVAAIQQLCKEEATVLVTAPSNTATDLLTERLAVTGLRVVRVGNISRIDESIMRHTLEVQMAEHPDAKNIKKVKIEAAELRRQGRKFKRTFGPEQRRERGHLFRQAGQLEGWARQLEANLIEQLLSGAQVITATLIGTAAQVLDKRTFKTVVIDEAAQALEPASWVAISKAARVVFAGDPLQLPPTIKSREAEKGGLSVSLLEKVLAKGLPNSLLRTQYRMHNTIMGLSNAYFYANKLQADISVAEARLPVPDNAPLVFIDTAGCGFTEKQEPKHKSWYNPEEYQILCEHLYLQLEAMRVKEIQIPITIIAPYREQVVYMTQLVEEDRLLEDWPIKVQTIDGFQGQECDIVYISLVRSNDKSNIGFLKDYRRMNVAMTRARQQLVIVGDSATIAQDKFYAELLDYVEKQGDYRTAWEYMR